MGFLDISEETLWKVGRVALSLLMMLALKACGIFMSIKIHQWYTKYFGPFDYESKVNQESEEVLSSESEWGDEETEILCPGDEDYKDEEQKHQVQDNAEQSKMKGEETFAEDEFKLLFDLVKSCPQSKDDDELMKGVDELLSQIRQRKIKKDIVQRELNKQARQKNKNN